MEILRVNKRYLLFTGVLSNDSLSKWANTFWKIFINSILAIGLLYSLIMTSALYMIHNPDDFSGAMSSFPNFCIGFSTCGAYSAFFSHEQTIKKLHVELQRIVGNGK